MATFPTYTKSKKGATELYIYDDISQKLRNQIFHILENYLKQSQYSRDDRNSLLTRVYNEICEEFGKKELENNILSTMDKMEQIQYFFDTLTDVDEVLDIVGIFFYFLLFLESAAKDSYSFFHINYTAENAIEDLNTRFRENGVGYQFVNKKIIKVDNDLIYKEAISPALSLISDKEYENVNDEYLKAHGHFRFKRNQECINECLKSFETTMKIICTKNNWVYDESDTAKKLINVLLVNHFVPPYQQTYFSALRQLLESSIPTIRNKKGGHGQGINKQNVPDELASFMLNITGSTIKFLIETQNSIRNQ